MKTLQMDMDHSRVEDKVPAIMDHPSLDKESSVFKTERGPGRHSIPKTLRWMALTPSSRLPSASMHSVWRTTTPFALTTALTADLAGKEWTAGQAQTTTKIRFGMTIQL